MAESTDQVKPVIRSLAYGDFVFESPAAMRDWLSIESSTWRDLSESSTKSVGEDPARQLGIRGSAEHANEWHQALTMADTFFAVSPGVANPAGITNAIEFLRSKFDSRDLIPSASALGTKIVGISKTDSTAAAITVCISTGRDVTRVIGERSGLTLWRTVPRIIEGFNQGDAASKEKHSAALKSAEIAAASVRALESEAKETTERVNEAFRLDDERRGTEWKELIEKFDTATDIAIKTSRQRCSDLEEFYKHKQALSAPRAYWELRRTSHKLQAGIWGGISIALIVGILLVLSENWFTPLARARDVLVVPTGQSVNWTAALPEIALIAAAAFLALWTLRFSVRQTAQHLARWEEAAQRVTMVSTFLALADYDTNGKPSLVSEADRAVMIQALFRPSGLHSPDDAPPSHWIEDVLKRVTEASKVDKE
jgi:hypothetical protein